MLVNEGPNAASGFQSGAVLQEPHILIPDSLPWNNKLNLEGARTYLEDLDKGQLLSQSTLDWESSCILVPCPSGHRTPQQVLKAKTSCPPLATLQVLYSNFPRQPPQKRQRRADSALEKVPWFFSHLQNYAPMFVSSEW
jgi:hypothetical protein